MDIEQIRAMVERALADGRLSRLESEAIKNAIYADKIVTREEAKLLRELHEKIWTGEIIFDDPE